MSAELLEPTETTRAKRCALARRRHFVHGSGLARVVAVALCDNVEVERVIAGALVPRLGREAVARLIVFAEAERARLGETLDVASCAFVFVMFRLVSALFAFDAVFREVENDGYVFWRAGVVVGWEA